MEKVEKIFDSVWGLIIFYAIIALVSIIVCRGINSNIASNTNNVEVERTYYA